MNPYRSISEQLMAHEGFRSRPYLCTAGRLTIGYGRNLADKGVSYAEAKTMLQNDIDESEGDCKAIFPKWIEFHVYRRWALIDMRFNLGPNRFRGFKKMITAINLSDWHEAAKQARDSRWFTQVGQRGYFIYRQLIGNSDGI